VQGTKATSRLRPEPQPKGRVAQLGHRTLRSSNPRGAGNPVLADVVKVASPMSTPTKTSIFALAVAHAWTAAAKAKTGIASVYHDGRSASGIPDTAPTPPIAPCSAVSLVRFTKPENQQKRCGRGHVRGVMTVQTAAQSASPCFVTKRPAFNAGLLPCRRLTKAANSKPLRCLRRTTREVQLP
jgi:hypothetical protein